MAHWLGHKSVGGDLVARPRESFVTHWWLIMLLVTLFVYVLLHVIHDVLWLLRRNCVETKDKAVETDSTGPVDDIFISAHGQRYHRGRGCSGLNSANQSGVSKRMPVPYAVSSILRSWK